MIPMNEIKAAALIADLAGLAEDHAQAILDAVAEIRAELNCPPQSAAVAALPLRCSSCEFGELVGTDGSIVCSIHGVTHVNASACSDHPAAVQKNSQKCENSRGKQGFCDVPTTEKGVSA
jgi:hypothetical protein